MNAQTPSTLKVRTRWEGNRLLVRILIQHPMENGRRRAENSQQIIPEHYITDLVVRYHDSPVIEGKLSTGISKDPYFAFELEGVRNGDTLEVSWTDNLGAGDQTQIRIMPNHD